MNKITKYDIMDCLGEWFKNDKGSYIDLEKKVWNDLSKEPIKEVTEIYKDISDEARAYRFYHLKLEEDAELFVRVEFN